MEVRHKAESVIDSAAVLGKTEIEKLISKGKCSWKLSKYYLELINKIQTQEQFGKFLGEDKGTM